MQNSDSVYEARLIIKTKATAGPRGAQGNGTQKTTLDDPIQRADSQECHGCKPGETETETEYLWSVCLTGGDRILFSIEETSGFWGPGVILSSGPLPPSDPHSLTSRVAFWATEWMCRRKESLW